MFAAAMVAGVLFFFYQGGVDKRSYLVSLLNTAYRNIASWSTISVATFPNPAPRNDHRVYAHCFVLSQASPRVSSYVCPSGTGKKSDTARRASGDATASSLISWTLFP